MAGNEVSDLKSAIEYISDNINLFDQNNVTSQSLNKRLNNTGVAVNASGYYVSNYISVEEGKTYLKNSPTEDGYHRICVYNSARTFIPGEAYNDNVITICQGGAYIRFCGELAEMNTAFFGIPSAKDIIARQQIIETVNTAFEELDRKKLNILDAAGPIIREEKKNPFEISDSANGYVTFTFDDLRDDLDLVAATFEEKGLPFCIAAIPSYLSHVANGLSSASGSYTPGMTMKQVCTTAQTLGCEIMTHNITVITEENQYDYDVMYNYFVVQKQKLEENGFHVRGLIKAGGTGSIRATDEIERWLIPYYDYSDMGIAANYNLTRGDISGMTLEEMKQTVLNAKQQHSWIRVYSHNYFTLLPDILQFCIDQNINVATYGNVFDAVMSSEMANDIALLKQLTGGAFAKIQANEDLNSYIVPGNYYCERNAQVKSLENCPVNVMFNMSVCPAVYGNTNYIVQSLKPYILGRNNVEYVRRYSTSTQNWTEWQSYATTDEATKTANGLMSADDKVKLDALHNESVITETNGGLYPSSQSTANDLLQLEKTRALYHDNFARADNVSDIGVNGLASSFAPYDNIASGTFLQIGISNQKAIATNPNNAPSGSVHFKVRDAGNYPYKLLMSYNTKGGVVISPVDAENYAYVIATSNAFKVGGIGSLAMTESTVTHNANVSSIEVYVDIEKIEVYIAGQKLYSKAFTPVNTLCGLYFSVDDISSIKYTNFDILTYEQNLICNIDDAIEKCPAPVADMIGLMQSANLSYGVKFDSTVKLHSHKSIRFEQRKADSSQIYRSELTPKNPRTTNGYQVNWQLQSKIIEFDMYLPDDYVIDSKQEILLQMHNTPDGVNIDGLYPNIALQTFNGHWGFYIRSATQKIQNASDAIENYYDLGEYETGKWTHFLIYLHDGYLSEHNPCTAVWMDGKLALYERIPNTYNTTRGSYLKMGMYKTSYISSTDTGSTVRVVYFDNIRIWM